MVMKSEQDRNGANTLEQLLPDRQDDIRWLRAQDPIFDEICTDYELIADVARKEASEDEAIAECLDGLKEEIHRALTRSADVS